MLLNRPGRHAGCLSFFYMRPAVDPQKQAILDAFKDGRINEDQATAALLKLDLERRRIARSIRLDTRRFPAA